MQGNNDFENRAWEQMHALLDKEMPQKKRRRFLLWWWFAGALILLAVIAMLFNKSNTNSDHQYIASEQKVETANHSKETATANSTTRNTRDSKGQEQYQEPIEKINSQEDEREVSAHQTTKIIASESHGSHSEKELPSKREIGYNTEIDVAQNPNLNRPNSDLSSIEYANENKNTSADINAKDEILNEDIAARDKLAEISYLNMPFALLAMNRLSLKSPSILPLRNRNAWRFSLFAQHKREFAQDANVWALGAGLEYQMNKWTWYSKVAYQDYSYNPASDELEVQLSTNTPDNSGKGDSNFSRLLQDAGFDIGDVLTEEKSIALQTGIKRNLFHRLAFSAGLGMEYVYYTRNIDAVIALPSVSLDPDPELLEIEEDNLNKLKGVQQYRWYLPLALSFDLNNNVYLELNADLYLSRTIKDFNTKTKYYGAGVGYRF